MHDLNPLPQLGAELLKFPRSADGQRHLSTTIGATSTKLTPLVADLGAHHHLKFQDPKCPGSRATVDTVNGPHFENTGIGLWTAKER